MSIRCSRIVPGVVLGALMLAPPALADGPIHGPDAQCAAERPLFGQPAIDVRSLDVQPTGDQLAAAERLEAAVGTVSRKAVDGAALSLRWSGYGTPKMLASRAGHLTAPSGDDPVDVVRGFVAANAELFGFTRASLARLELLRVYTTQHNGATHVGLRLTDEGRPVFGAVITATVDAEGRLVVIGGAYDPHAIARNPVLVDARGAVSRALEAVGVTPPARLERMPGRDRVAFVNPVADLRAPMPLTAELVTFSLGAAGARVAWRTVTEVDETGTYETVVDATTGELLFRRNLVDATGPEGNVYRVQNPTLGSQQITAFTGVNGSWVDDRTTDGNNAIAYHDLDDSNSVGYQPQTPDNADPAYQHFDYTYTDAINTSSGTDVTTDRDAVITQAFYYVNMLHDYYYGLGFDEAAGNFQEDNFGNGGSGSDRVLVEVDNGFDNGDCCNAFMNTPADGGNPRLTLRVGLAPDNLYMHRAMNGDTVTHEFGHGVSNRLVGSGNLGSGAQTDALGEGWSDALATELWNDPVYGEYNNGNAATGIRGVAYDTSTLVYSDLCSGGCQEHTDGRIWATVMWQVRAALIGLNGQAAGAATHAQLLIDGMKNTPTDPSYLDARDGYIAADVLNSGGANFCVLWRVFAEREMGTDAASVNNGSSVTAGTAVPASCIPVADAGGPYQTPEGQPVALDASASAPASDPSGGALSYAWDLDDDGDFDDATGLNPSFDAVGQDGVYPVAVQVTNAAGVSDIAATTVTVTNVAPTVSIAVGQVTQIDEYQVIQVSATFSDPGWLDTYTYVIDWGTPAGDTSGGAGVVTTQGGPGPDLGVVDDLHQYGDNGDFLITVTVYDDDGAGSDSFILTVDNVDPTATIDLAGTILVNGVPAIVAHAGEDIPFSGRSTDPGSDDLTLAWDWDDGAPAPDESTVYWLVDGVPDPLLSPSVDPRDVTDDQTHAFAEACLYEVVFASTDDDSGTADDTLAVIIAGNAELTRSAGYWYQAYRRSHNQPFTDGQLACFLDIVAFMSTVFDEVRSVATVEQAADLLKGTGNADMEEIFDRQLLAAWLNFANGSVDLGTELDLDGDAVPDGTFAAIVAAAEAVRVNPAATDAELEAQKDLLEIINEGSF